MLTAKEKHFSFVSNPKKLSQENILTGTRVDIFVHPERGVEDNLRQRKRTITIFILLSALCLKEHTLWYFTYTNERLFN
jgi:hypothetical protein